MDFCPKKSQPFGNSAEIDRILEETIENNKDSQRVARTFFKDPEAKAAFSGKNNESLRLLLQEMNLQKPNETWLQHYAVADLKKYIFKNWGFKHASQALRVAGLKFESKLAEKIGLSEFDFKRTFPSCFVENDLKTPQEYQNMVAEPSIFDKLPKINIFENSDVGTPLCLVCSRGRKRLFIEMDPEDDGAPKNKKREIEQKNVTFSKLTTRFGNCISTLWFWKRRNEQTVQANLNKSNFVQNFTDVKIFLY